MVASERLAAAVEAAQDGGPVEDAARRYDVPAHVERMLLAMDAMDDPVETLWRAIMNAES